MTEPELAQQLRDDLQRIPDCIFCEQVWMACFTHARRPQADRLRIDFVIELSGRLLGIEVKAPAEHAADLGRQLLQCAQYAAGKITVNTARVPAHWIGQPLTAVFLRTTRACHSNWFSNHLLAAHRLFGPANVGFVVREQRGLCLRLCAERFWTEWSGYHQGMLTKLARRGNGSFMP